ncbi:putative transposase [Ancylobacter sp. 3268]|uniref:Mu transposase C-terminal domain-containing protein n=1 Tax=Ancylobacter sp. 3268 TaxID=2817752 RepID=UPI0028557F6F|nr:Mu transposase C-terminal domain-containing protein [Ancylobacter sp. 3268]MDR6952646.1 putative transposase [Ancylobacter sp. 3268]
MTDLGIADIAAALNVEKRSAERRAKEGNWPYREVRVKGGRKRLYSRDTLPPEVRSRIDAQAIVSTKTAETTRQIATINTTTLTARQRQVMEARAALLLEIDRRAAFGGLSITAAVRSLVDDSAAGRLDATLSAAVAVANDRSGGEPRVKERILFQWRSARTAGGIAALAPIPTKTAQDLPKWFGEFLPYYARPQKPTIARALTSWSKDTPGAELPSYQQVRRALDKLGVIDRMRGREGAQALKARQAYTARDASDLLPTSVYLADGKTFDAEIAHPIHGQPFRPELTTIVDAHTRRIVGFSAALDESAVAVTDALRVACVHSGIPAIFYTDRGPGYVNDAMDAPMTGLLGRLGITPMRALPYNSQAKGIVERLNHEWSHLARDFATYISRDMDREAKKAAHHATRRELAVSGTSRLLPSWEDFLVACRAAIDAYNDRPHRGLPRTVDPVTGGRRHMSPAEAWEAAFARGFEAILVTPGESEDLFRPWVIRRARRALIEWLGNSYFAPELEAVEGEDVIVAYDIHDAARVWVRSINVDANGDRQPGPLLAVAAFEGHKTRYVPLSAEQAALEKRAAARRRRLQGHMDIVDQELRPTLLLEGPAPIDHLDLPYPLSIDDERDMVPVRVEAPSSARPIFQDDVQFARWLLTNPGSATEQDIAFVRSELLGSTAAREELRLAGIDLDALRDLMREAA